MEKEMADVQVPNIKEYEAETDDKLGDIDSMTNQDSNVKQKTKKTKIKKQNQDIPKYTFKEDKLYNEGEFERTNLKKTKKQLPEGHSDIEGPKLHGRDSSQSRDAPGYYEIPTASKPEESDGDAAIEAPVIDVPDDQATNLDSHYDIQTNHEASGPDLHIGLSAATESRDSEGYNEIPTAHTTSNPQAVKGPNFKDNQGPSRQNISPHFEADQLRQPSDDKNVPNVVITQQGSEHTLTAEHRVLPEEEFSDDNAKGPKYHQGLSGSPNSRTSPYENEIPTAHTTSDPKAIKGPKLSEQKAGESQDVSPHHEAEQFRKPGAEDELNSTKNRAQQQEDLEQYEDQVEPVDETDDEANGPNYHLGLSSKPSYRTSPGHNEIPTAQTTNDPNAIKGPKIARNQAGEQQGITEHHEAEQFRIPGAEDELNARKESEKLLKDSERSEAEIIQKELEMETDDEANGPKVHAGLNAKPSSRSSPGHNEIPTAQTTNDPNAIKGPKIARNQAGEQQGISEHHEAEQFRIPGAEDELNARKEREKLLKDSERSEAEIIQKELEMETDDEANGPKVHAGLNAKPSSRSSPGHNEIPTAQTTNDPNAIKGPKIARNQAGEQQGISEHHEAEQFRIPGAEDELNARKEREKLLKDSERSEAEIIQKELEMETDDEANGPKVHAGLNAKPSSRSSPGHNEIPTAQTTNDPNAIKGPKIARNQAGEQQGISEHHEAEQFRIPGAEDELNARKEREKLLKDSERSEAEIIQKELEMETDDEANGPKVHAGLNAKPSSRSSPGHNEIPAAQTTNDPNAIKGPKIARNQAGEQQDISQHHEAEQFRIPGAEDELNERKEREKLLKNSERSEAEIIQKVLEMETDDEANGPKVHAGLNAKPSSRSSPGHNEIPTAQTTNDPNAIKGPKIARNQAGEQQDISQHHEAEQFRIPGAEDELIERKEREKLLKDSERSEAEIIQKELEMESDDEANGPKVHAGLNAKPSSRSSPGHNEIPTAQTTNDPNAIKGPKIARNQAGEQQDISKHHEAEQFRIPGAEDELIERKEREKLLKGSERSEAEITQKVLEMETDDEANGPKVHAGLNAKPSPRSSPGHNEIPTAQTTNDPNAIKGPKIARNKAGEQQDISQHHEADQFRKPGAEDEFHAKKESERLLKASKQTKDAHIEEKIENVPDSELFDKDADGPKVREKRSEPRYYRENQVLPTEDGYVKEEATEEANKKESLVYTETGRVTGFFSTETGIIIYLYY